MISGTRAGQGGCGAEQRHGGRNTMGKRRARCHVNAPSQLAQNLAPGAAAVPHSVQCTPFGAIGVPQLEQNLAPGAFGAWQFAQALPPAPAAGTGAGPGEPRAPEFGAAPAEGPTPIPATMPPKPMPTPSAAVPPPPAAAPSPIPLSAAPTPYSRKPPASRVYAVSLRKPFKVCSSSGLKLMVTLPSRVIFRP